MFSTLKMMMAGAQPVVLPPSNADELAAYWEGYFSQQAGQSLRACRYPRGDELRGYWHQGYAAAELWGRKKPAPDLDTAMTLFDR